MAFAKEVAAKMCRWKLAQLGIRSGVRSEFPGTSDKISHSPENLHQLEKSDLLTAALAGIECSFIVESKLRLLYDKYKNWRADELEEKSKQCMCLPNVVCHVCIRSIENT